MYIYRRRHNVATTLVALAISMSGCSMMPSIDNSISEGHKALSDGQLDRAEQHFQQAISAAGKTEEHKKQVAIAKTGLADTYVEEDIYDDAETLYEDALELEGNASSPTTVKVYHGLGRLNLKRQTYLQADTYLNKALKLQAGFENADPVETAKILADLGELHQLRGKPSSAKKDYESALEILDGLENKQYKLQTKVMEALANIAADGQDMDAAQEYKKRLTDLQLDHAKNVMSVLPWVNVKKDDASSEDAEGSQEADSASDDSQGATSSETDK